MRTVWGFLVALMVCVGIAVAATETRADGPITVSFTTLGAHSFTVPANVKSIHVVAVGAPGGSVGPVPGGKGGIATADVAVTPGEVLGVFVGGTGESGGLGEGGYNGGGDSSAGEGGGGASDVRVGNPGSYASRLVVAGGGGGAGVQNGQNVGTAGGSAGESGAQPTGVFQGYCGPGGGATATQPGTGGAPSASGETFTSGNPGGLGYGAYGPGGGGGGAGLFGGGSGSGYINDFAISNLHCGGGGGSSGFGAGTSATATAIASAGAQPSVTITFATPSTTGPGSSGGSSGGGSSGGSSSGSPSGGGTVQANLSLPKNQHGKSVVGTVQVRSDRSALKAKLLWQRTKTSKPLVFGRLVDAPLKKGLHSFTVKLNGAGNRKLATLGSLKMTLAVTLSPPQGAVATANKPVTLKP